MSDRQIEKEKEHRKYEGERERERDEMKEVCVWISLLRECKEMQGHKKMH